MVLIKPFYQLFFLPEPSRSYVDFITRSSNCRSWTRLAMQILLKWPTSVFVMLVLKKRIRFIGSLPLQDSDFDRISHRLLRQTMKEETTKKREKERFVLCNACQFMKLTNGGWNSVLSFSFFLFQEIYITNYGWSFHVLKKREPGRHFIIIFVVFLITSPLWIVIVCIVFYMICTWFSLLSLSNPSWIKLLEAYFFGGAVNKKSIY